MIDQDQTKKAHLLVKDKITMMDNKNLKRYSNFLMQVFYINAREL